LRYGWPARHNPFARDRRPAENFHDDSRVTTKYELRAGNFAGWLNNTGFSSPRRGIDDQK